MPHLLTAGLVEPVPHLAYLVLPLRMQEEAVEQAIKMAAAILRVRADLVVAEQVQNTE